MHAFSENLWTDEEQAYWLAFDKLGMAAMSAARLRMLFERAHTLKTVWHAGRDELMEFEAMKNPELVAKFIEMRRKVDPERVWQDWQELTKTGVRAYPLMHPEFPFRLREIHDPPRVLYMLGELLPDSFPHACAVVGTRKPTTYGKGLAKEFSRGLSASGVAVVSGMALGIDSIAHWGAIEGGGKTVAVLATGVDLCYPSSNKPLYDKLTSDKACAILSEYFPGTQAEKFHFPMRNRIISGLCQAVLVIEAGETSGSLITARLGFEQSREVFAVPGRIDSLVSKGTNLLIRENVANLCDNFEQILVAMKWVKGPMVRDIPTVVELYGKEREVFEMLAPEPTHFDYLCEKSGIATAELSATLTMLELAGIVTRHPGDWYSRDRSISTAH